MTERTSVLTVKARRSGAPALEARAVLRPAVRRLGAVALGFAGGWAVLYGALMPFGLGLVLGLAEDCFAPCAAGAALGVLLHGFGALSLRSVCLLCALGAAVAVRWVWPGRFLPAVLAGCGTLAAMGLCFALGTGGGAELALFCTADALLAGPKLEGPSLAHWLGTDSFGRDIFSRVLQGAGTTFLIALSTVAIGAVCGTAAGALTGYFGGVVDEVLMRLNDALTAFPSILLALVLISILGPGNKYNVVIALGIVFIPSFARVTRTAFAALRDVNYVKSARLMGASSGRILVRQILPNTTQVLLPAITIGFNNAVLAEASMSYLGIGVTPPDASLGYMLSEAQSMMGVAPWYALFTGGTIVLLVFGVGLIGEGLQRRGGEVV